MRKFFLLILTTILFSSIYGQANKAIPRDIVSSIKNEAVLVVIDGNSVFDVALKKAVEKEWKFSKYEFTTTKELQSNYKERSYVPIYGFFDGSIEGQNGRSIIPCLGLITKFKTKDGVTITNTGKKKDAPTFDLRGKRVLDFNRYIAHEEDPKEEIESDVAFITQQISQFLTTLEKAENKVKTRNSYTKFVNKKDVKSYQKTTLLICQDDLDEKLKKSDVIAKYKGKCEVVDKKRFNQALAQNEKVLIYRFYQNSHNIVDCATNELLYYGVFLMKTKKKAQMESFSEFGKRL